MREWQVGDPIGLGDDAGVPDVPYMGYLKDERNSEENYAKDPEREFERALDRVISRVYASEGQKIQLRDNIKSIALSCRIASFDLRSTPESTEFVFRQENEYMSSTHTYLFYPDYPFGNFGAFYDIIPNHDYSKLRNMESCQRMIREKELELGTKFIGFGGGFKTVHTGSIELSDECRVFAHFELKEGEIVYGSSSRCFSVDLEKMQLKKV